MGLYALFLLGSNILAPVSHTNTFRTCCWQKQDVFRLHLWWNGLEMGIVLASHRMRSWFPRLVLPDGGDKLRQKNSGSSGIWRLHWQFNRGDCKWCRKGRKHSSTNLDSEYRGQSGVPKEDFLEEAEPLGSAKAKSAAGYGKELIPSYHLFAN